MARVGVLAVALGAAVASATAAADGAAAPPTFVQQALPAAALLGQGQMRFLGLRIYDARLWWARNSRRPTLVTTRWRWS